MSVNLSDSPTPLYGPRVGVALRLAADAFDRRLRKGSQVPYLTHLLAVASLVMDYGGDEDQIVAAVLHDLLEDIDPVDILNRIGIYGYGNAVHSVQQRRLFKELDVRFGSDAVAIIQALSDTTTPGAKEDWATRKRAYIERLRGESESVKVVAAADKSHNMESLVRDFDTIGAHVFARFGDTTVHDHLWYYTNVTYAICAGCQHPITKRLYDTFRTLEHLLKDKCAADYAKSCAFVGVEDPLFGGPLRDVVRADTLPLEKLFVVTIPAGAAWGDGVEIARAELRKREEREGLYAIRLEERDVRKHSAEDLVALGVQGQTGAWFFRFTYGT